MLDRIAKWIESVDLLFPAFLYLKIQRLQMR